MWEPHTRGGILPSVVVKGAVHPSQHLSDLELDHGREILLKHQQNTCKVNIGRIEQCDYVYNFVKFWNVFPVYITGTPSKSNTNISGKEDQANIQCMSHMDYHATQRGTVSGLQIFFFQILQSDNSLSHTSVHPLITFCITGNIPKESLEALILTSKTKGPDGPTHYRPISLLNTDIKLYAKLLTSRLTTFLPNLIHNNQVGFVPQRQTSNGNPRFLNLIQWAELHWTPSLLISLDAEKTFNARSSMLLHSPGHRLTLSHI